MNVLFIKEVLKDMYRYLSNFTNMALELNTDHSKLLANTIPDWLSTYIRDFSKWLLTRLYIYNVALPKFHFDFSLVKNFNISHL